MITQLLGRGVQQTQPTRVFCIAHIPPSRLQNMQEATTTENRFPDTRPFFLFDEPMRLLGLLTKAWMEGFYSPLLWPAERQNSMLLALCLSLSLILYIPELSDPLPWLSPNSSNQGGLPYSWGRSCKEWLQGAQAFPLQPCTCIPAIPLCRYK